MDIKNPFEEAELYFDQGDFKKSIQLYSLAIERDQQNAHIISKRGVAFFRIGKNDEALYDLNMALNLEPDNPYRYSSRAFILSNINRIDEAIRDYEKAIELDPEDAIAFNNLGLLQEKKGYMQAANNNFKRADTIHGIKPRNINAYESPLPNIPKKEQKENYSELSYWQFIKRIFTDSKLRKDFFRFIKNGFK
jgi:tetratricopeptide (TPR) repeat protein